MKNLKVGDIVKAKFACMNDNRDVAIKNDNKKLKGCVNYEKQIIKRMYEDVDYLAKNLNQDEVLDFIKHINAGVTGIKK